METCPKCNSLLRTCDSFYSFENDNTPDLPTKAFVNIRLICSNAACEDYAGTDLSNPRVIVDTVRNELNPVVGDKNVL